MKRSLTSQSRKVLALANKAARAFNHEYVGTEHILLGLIEERSAGVTDVLEIFGIDAEKIRAEIDKLVTRGTHPVALKSLPLTPRARQAIEHAHNDTRLMGESCIPPEHLFLGLMTEPDGVACQVLLNLGITPSDLRKEVFKIRMEQMRIVERIVRPVQASTPRKRKMREELLAHLSAVYDQELAKLHKPAAALEASGRRLGDPVELSRELEAALPFHERISYVVERWFAWRAPESIARYAWRQALLTFYILAFVLLPLAAAVILRYGWIPDTKTFVRVLTSILLISPPAHFILCVTAIKMRNAVWGVFGSRKSLLNVFVYGVLTAIVVTISFICFAWSIEGNLAKVLASPQFFICAGVASAIANYLVARLDGPATIRDTLWAMLDTEAA